MNFNNEQFLEVCYLCSNVYQCFSFSTLQFCDTVVELIFYFDKSTILNKSTIFGHDKWISRGHALKSIFSFV